MAKHFSKMSTVDTSDPLPLSPLPVQSPGMAATDPLPDPDRLEGLVANALRRAGRCSSDPVCAMRTPRDPEDFLHGAACHCCVFASETTCERSNRFLDRRFLVPLPGNDLAFFGTP